MSDYIMMFKISDTEGSVVYFQHDENVMSVVQGFVDYAEPQQTMVIETVLMTREEVDKLPRGLI